MSIKESDAQTLFSRVVANDIGGVEKLLNGGNSITWREVIRYELSLAKMLDTTESLAALRVLHKLMAYEIITMSSFHAAAMMGNDDILVALLDKDIPVDIALQSGTNALHLASFAGEVDTVKLLIDVYKAEANKQDKYGWSALHYACTEGHKDVADYLINAGVDVSLRDKDGTTCVFRAEANRHNELVTFLCQFGDEDNLLNVYEDVQASSPSDDLYAKPKKPQDKKKTTPAKPDKPPKPPLKKTPSGSQFMVDDDSPLYDFAGGGASARRNSSKGDLRSKTLPTRRGSQSSMGKNTIRRMIRAELESAFAGDYMEPQYLTQQKKKQRQPRLSDVSIDDLKAVMREELDRFKTNTGFRSNSVSVEEDVFESPDNNNDYEDLYATLKSLPRAPSPPAPGAPGPPLPPRNDTLRPGEQTLAMRALDNAIEQYDTGTMLSGLTLSRSVPNAALSESFKRLAPKLGDNWRQLSHALPIASTSSKVAQRIMEIEVQYPDSKEKQAALALGEWRQYKGKDADVDSLIIAMRKCRLQDMIPDVEKVTQEFTA